MSGRHHDISGPESLDLATMAALAARQWGTSLEYVGAAVHQALEPAHASVWIKQR